MTNAYNAYIGLPIYTAISFILFYYGYTHINFENGVSFLALPIALSVLSAVFKLIGITLFTIACEYEDMTKVKQNL